MSGPTERAETAAPVGRPDALTLTAFLVLVVLVGGNVVGVRFVNRELAPFWGAGSRFALAALLFAGYAAARRLPLPRGRALGAALVFGVLQFGVGFALGYWALQEVPAGLASVILASIPLFTLGFAALARLESLTARGVAGAVVAIVGIALLFGERAGRDVPVPHLAANVAMAACFALVGVVIKRAPPVPLATMNAVGMAVGAAILLVLSAAAGERAAIPAEPATWAAQAYLVLPGSVGVFALLLYVLRRWTASGVSYQTVLSPLVSIALAAWLLDEPLTSGLLLGAGLVLAGVYIGALAGGGGSVKA